MTIRARFFAVLREKAGVSETMLQCPTGSCVADAISQIRHNFPALEKYLDRSACAVNQTYVGLNTALHDNDELALIPPVSGGADDDWIDILATPIDPAAAIQFVSHASAGGIDIFLGTTRAEINSAGHALLALDYEAYDQMARKQLRDLAAEVRQTRSIIRVAILHRVGRVAVGEASVLIAVASPHRAEAFDACRWLIDMLKKDVAIWKKEIWQHGGESWSGER